MFYKGTIEKYHKVKALRESEGLSAADACAEVGMWVRTYFKVQKALEPRTFKSVIAENAILKKQLRELKAKKGA